MELPGPGIPGARNSFGSADPVLLRPEKYPRRSDRAGRARGRKRAIGAALRAARKEMRSLRAAARREASPARNGDGQRAPELRLAQRQREDPRENARRPARQARPA